MVKLLIPDTEDKTAYINQALNEEKEFCFVANAKQTKYKFEINAEKETNKYAIDLEMLNELNGIKQLVEFKGQFTPFYKSKKICNIDPEYYHRITVRQFQMYKEQHTLELKFIFYTKFEASTGYNIFVPSVHGAYLISLENLIKHIEKYSFSRLPLNRQKAIEESRIGNNDIENFPLDLSKEEFERIF